MTIFLEHVTVAICISLFASLFIAKTLIPLLTTKVKIPVVKMPKTPSYMKGYGRALNWMLKHQGNLRYRVIYPGIDLCTYAGGYV